MTKHRLGEEPVPHDCSPHRCCNACGRHLVPHVMQIGESCEDDETRGAE